MWIEQRLRPRRERSSGRGPISDALGGAGQDDGFTLLELIVAVIVIGVLAAIAVPVYNGQQNSARDSAAKAELVNFKTAMMSYGITHGGSFANTQSGKQPVAGILKPYGWDTGSPATDLWLNRTSDTDFCADAVGIPGQVGWRITALGGLENKWCSWP